MEAINGDLTQRVSVDSTAMDWTPSPSGTVWRKRMHLVGPLETGQVTSIVRYEPGATFPIHDHPDGEEILVLEGIFSDEHGDWPAGTYLLNPEGFRHAPFSRDGCTLFVKLRQFPGRDRQHVAVQSKKLSWQATPSSSIKTKPLYDQHGFSDSMRLEQWPKGTALGTQSYPNGAELYVLDGTFEDEHGCYSAGTWLRFPTGSAHAPKSVAGCELHIKTGGLRYLLSA